MDFPPISIVMTTYITVKERKQAAEKTLASWEENLKYEGTARLIIADDGSTLDWQPKKFWSRPILTVGQKRHGVGASLNKGFALAFETSPLVLYAVDDWALTEELDLTPWAQLLLEREDVGVVRLGPPHPGISGTVEIFTTNWQGWGLRLNWSNYAFGHRPALYHQRMIDNYGWFKEDCSALECEKQYAEHFYQRRRIKLTTGPDVVLALPHKFQHLDSIELSSMEPK
jgi:hypothetical protein